MSGREAMKRFVVGVAIASVVIAMIGVALVFLPPGSGPTAFAVVALGLGGGFLSIICPFWDR